MKVGDEVKADREFAGAPVGTVFAVTDSRNFPGETHYAVVTAEGFLRWVYPDGRLGCATRARGCGVQPTGDLALDDTPSRRVTVRAVGVDDTSPATLRAAMRWGSR